MYFLQFINCKNLPHHHCPFTKKRLYKKMSGRTRTRKTAVKIEIPSTKPVEDDDISALSEQVEKLEIVTGPRITTRRPTREKIIIKPPKGKGRQKKVTIKEEPYERFWMVPIYPQSDYDKDELYDYLHSIEDASGDLKYLFKQYADVKKQKSFDNYRKDKAEKLFEELNELVSAFQFYDPKGGNELTFKVEDIAPTQLEKYKFAKIVEGILMTRNFSLHEKLELISNKHQEIFWEAHQFRAKPIVYYEDVFDDEVDYIGRFDLPPDRVENQRVKIPSPKRGNPKVVVMEDDNLY